MNKNHKKKEIFTNIYEVNDTRKEIKLMNI